jgi:hypothetical protein
MHRSLGVSLSNAISKLFSVVFSNMFLRRRMVALEKFLCSWWQHIFHTTDVVMSFAIGTYIELLPNTIGNCIQTHFFEYYRILHPCPGLRCSTMVIAHPFRIMLFHMIFECHLWVVLEVSDRVCPIFELSCYL